MADIRDTTGTALSWLSTPRGTQGVLAAGLSVLAAAGATVVLHTADPASADTRIDKVHLAVVRLPDGREHAAQEGEVLPRGAELRTGNGGGAQLVTAGRRVFVGGLSTLSVQDGVRETLRKGLALVDARDGVRLALTTPAGLVAAPAGSVVRVEEGASRGSSDDRRGLDLTRVAVYDGTVALHPVGRASTTTIERLHQVKLQVGSLPQRTTALQLLDDVWDESVAADLVAADTDLTSLADGLSKQEGATYLTTVSAAFRTGAIPADGAARGEEALAVLVAQASRSGDPDVLAKVRADRADLGSWGVVAELARATVSDISAVLSAALAPSTPGPGSPTNVDAGPAVNTPTLSPTVAPTDPSGRPTSRPTTSSSPTPNHTSPPPTQDPGLVQSVVTTVTGLLPHPTPAPPGDSKPAPTPSPTKKPCLLGAVLC